tara:strand:+ start:729 stop:953 length:225 start_codon:yes stop_codon:yes gene_type:complete
MDALVIIMLCILCLLLIYLLVLIFVSLFICVGAIVYNIKLYFYPKKKEQDKKYNLESIIIRNPNGGIQLGILSV